MQKMKRAYLKLWLGYTDFSGETRRADFWWAMLANFIIGLTLAALSWYIGVFGFIRWAYSVMMILPTVTMLARRLHSAGRGTIWLFALLVPVAGWLLVLAFACMKDKTD